MVPLSRNGGGGKSWVAEIQKAKLYTKLSQARGQVTFWSNHSPNIPAPVIVEFSMSLDNARVLDETDRVEKAKMKKLTTEAERERREARHRLKSAQDTIKRAEAEIASLRAKGVK